MRALAIGVVLGVGILAYTVEPVRTKLSSVATELMGAKGDATNGAASDAGAGEYIVAHDGSVWRRMPDGTTQLWQNKKWVSGAAPAEVTAYKPVIENQTASAEINATRRFSRDANSVIDPQH